MMMIHSYNTGFFAILMVLSLASVGWSRTCSGVFNIVDFGAVGDAQTDDSQAFLKAWKATCSADHQPVLQIPSNKKFVLNAVKLEGPCKSAKVHISVLGDIVAAEMSNWNSNDTDLWIAFSNVDGLVVNGLGQIDGRGQNWWSYSKSSHPLDGRAKYRAPTVLSFFQCNGIRLSELSILDSPRNHIRLNITSDVTISNMKLTSPQDSPNTDGIDILNSTHVQVVDSVIGTGDDCVGIIYGCSSIVVKNITCGPGHGISVGSLGRNGEHVKVKDIHVSNITFIGTTNGVRIKTWQGGSGYAKNITFEQIMLYNVTNPIIIDQYYCDSTIDCGVQKSNVQVTDVHYKGVTGFSQSENAISLNCSMTVPCKDITMEDVNIKLAKDGHPAYSKCAHAHGRAFNTTPFVPCLN